MEAGREHTGTPFIWPPQLIFEHPRPITVYLDLNFWIGLAQASVGHTGGGRYQALFEQASALVKRNRVMFPLSAQHYMEMSAIEDPRQRGDLANVMQDLSGYRTLLSLPLLIEMEVEAGINQILGTSSGPYKPIHAIGTGFGHAFGIVGTLNIVDGRDDGAARSRWPGGPDDFDVIEAEAQATGEWMMLRGPLDSDLTELHKSGYDPKTASIAYQNRARQELHHAQQLDDEPKWRKGRLRDVMRGRYLSFELIDLIGAELQRWGRTAEDLQLDNKQISRDFIDAMPSGDVRVSLHTECHRNPSSKWERNDMADISALSNAVPLCDAVATDKRRAHELRISKVAKRHNTRVFASPNEVLSYFVELGLSGQ